MTIGIYAIINKKNGKRYIGQSIRVERRLLYDHRRTLRKNIHWNIHLQNAWNLYGEKCFEFLLIEKCSIRNLTKREQYWMDFYKARRKLYNMTPAAGTTLGFTFKMPESAKKKLAESLRRAHGNLTGKSLTKAERGRKQVARKLKENPEDYKHKHSISSAESSKRRREKDPASYYAMQNKSQQTFKDKKNAEKPEGYRLYMNEASRRSTAKRKKDT